MKTKYFDINESPHLIKCKLYCNELRGMDHVVIFGHGFGGHMDNKAAERFAETLLSKHKKSALLVFNWPCHGNDIKHNMSLKDCLSYVELVLNYVKEQMQPKNIDIHATSFGAYVFLKYVADYGNPFRRLVLRCPAINMYDVMMDKVISKGEAELLEKGREVQVGFDRKIGITKDFTEELRQNDIRQYEYFDDAENILMIHGTKDEIIPIEIAASFADDNVIELIPIENADHRFQDYALMGAAIRETLNFLFGS